MSLETALAENTAALRELIAAIANSRTALQSPGAIAYAEQKAAVLEPAEPVLEKPKAKRAEKAAPAVEPPPPAEPAAPALTYEDIRGPFLTQLVAKHGRDAGAALLAEFGVPAGGKLSDIAADKWPAVLEAITTRCAS